uniref:Uncharacterized protein n=1 Tax=Oryza punctata TaxID=4537 RepID=A0A0E0KNX4_ORYPU
METSHPGTRFDALTLSHSPPELAAQSSLPSKAETLAATFQWLPRSSAPGNTLFGGVVLWDASFHRRRHRFVTGVPEPFAPPLLLTLIWLFLSVCALDRVLKIFLRSLELKWTQKATLKLQKATFRKASHRWLYEQVLGWTCGRGFGQVDMIHNSGIHQSSDRLVLLRPSKCPTARTDQYPTGQ